MSNSKVSLKKAVLINSSGKYIRILLAIVVNAILSRILSPEEFGIIAIITVFSTFFNTLSDMGFGAAIIQKKDLTQYDINHIYSFTVYISVILMMIFQVLSIPISFFYNDSVYIRLGFLLSLSLLFNTMNMVPNGMLNREKQFIKLAYRTILSYLIPSIIAILAAIIGLSFYSLVLQSILSSFILFIWNRVDYKLKFVIRIDLFSIKKVMNYSSYQFAFNVINYFSRNLDNLLTGKLLGNAELGYYNKAYTLMLYPVNNLTGVVSPVLHPVLADYQSQYELIYKKYMKVVCFLSALACFVTVFCWFNSYELVVLMYGSNWAESVICFEILSFAIFPQMLNSSAGAIFQVLGKTKLLFINGCINTAITVIAIIMGICLGGSIQCLSLGVAIAYILQFFCCYVMLIHAGFGFSFFDFLKAVLPDMVHMVVLFTAAYFWPFEIRNTLMAAGCKTIYLIAVYALLLVVSKRYKLLLDLF
ncbi:oligosaccharide flippase family protein [Lachnospiraceae bacterium WCA-9-b2]|uniref:Oligosaccharide flippase family protein n=1 Tax=Sporofaciens musculi TaxID=2681861 RepID=A0A7X3MET6_9FIRM|nr:lipopolysaccharide biosynthesis protein [Sporofaciens musculi]MXP75120.1 oligosaccharide flippase family protein [Sporofaciens musculi]